jgi:glutamate-5-semialdehyde dehydrogenase
MSFIPQPARTTVSKVVRADGVREEPFITEIDPARLGHEWEWEESPEVTLHVVDDIDEAVRLCNEYSPHFVATLISSSSSLHDRFWSTVDTPFVGDGMSRWVDGQYALSTPELGLSNWEGGRMLGRGAILSGDSVFTVRYRATITDPNLHR